jgi:hypothetical protein
MTANQERYARLYAVAGTAYREAYGRDGLGFEPAMQRAVQAVLSALGDNPNHVAELGTTAYTIQHPLACRPDLLACPYSGATLEGPPTERGRYRVVLGVEGDLLLAGRVEEDRCE